MNKPAPFAQPVDLRGKKIIVTGCSPNSIGFATAKTLASWGATVIVTTRSKPEVVKAALDAALLKSGQEGTITAHALDLCQTQSVSAFVDWYKATQGEQLDVLINNAGIHLDLRSQWQEPNRTSDGFEIHWRTNYLGTFQLTQLLLPLLSKTAEQSGDARVVNVVSMLHTRGRNKYFFQPQEIYNSWVAYGTSKLALVHHTFEIQRRYAACGLQAYCLHPGAVFTNIADKGLEGHTFLNALRKIFSPVEAFFLLTPEEGAQTQIHCATSPNLQGGIYYRQCRPAPVSDESADVQVSKKLWEETELWIKTVTG
jgi:NAD(P)-dependent dehydrogenase (short-subunit alcohol dehydrogenase family)